MLKASNAAAPDGANRSELYAPELRTIWLSSQSMDGSTLPASWARVLMLRYASEERQVHHLHGSHIHAHEDCKTCSCFAKYEAAVRGPGVYGGLPE